jgi:hypothetical protein
LRVSPKDHTIREYVLEAKIVLSIMFYLFRLCWLNCN